MERKGNTMKLIFKTTLLLIFLILVIFFAFNMFSGNKQQNIIKLYDTKADKLIYIDEDDYLTGVVAGEMPASFETEALKAQAISARSYYLSRAGKNNKAHKYNADVCTDFAHCQAYSDIDTLKNNWGRDFNKNFKKINNAVKATKGVVLTYNGKIIDAVFHSTSPGRTQNSEDVWSEKKEYLRSVESKIDKNSPKFINSKSFTVDELKKLLKIDGDVTIDGVEYNEGLTIKRMVISGMDFKGTQIRQLLGLKSACFEVEFKDDFYAFNTKGYGHGVGMSQWGANLMAKEGSTYKKILKKYYTGVEVTRLK